MNPRGQRLDDWSDLVEIWNRSEPPPSITLRLVKRQAAWARLRFHIEAWGSLIAGAYGIYVAVQDASPEVGLASVAFTLFVFSAAIWSRTREIPADLETPHDVLGAAIDLAERQHRWARGSQGCCVAAFVFLWVVGLYGGRELSFQTYAVVSLALTLAMLCYSRKARRARSCVHHYRTMLVEWENQ